MLNLKTAALAATLAIASVGAFAQTPATSVDQRQINQGERIDAGVAKGELTPQQTKHLAKQQRKIDKAKAKAEADGVVTPKEQAKLTKMQDHASATIAKDKKD